MKFTPLLFIFFSLQIDVMAQIQIPLYSGTIPNSIIRPSGETLANDGIIRISKVSVPTLTVFNPPTEKKNGIAVVICPGGGYVIEAIGHEGYDVARRLNAAGITCFVLKYRLPSDSIMPDKTIGPLQDAQRSIQYVRENAEAYHVNPKKIGIMGFSAGGHLASTEGTHFKKALIANPLKTSLRPDFMILVYPVINLSDSLMNEGSRNNLLGKNPSKEMIRNYSNDLQVNKETPPTFLVHARDDQAVKVQNSIHFYDALQKHRIPSNLYLYEKGGHGFGMNNPTSTVQWINLAIEWLKIGGF
ncbi:MAG: hypothetical protein NVS1B13_18460 [Flavisolibacter sp.]